MQFLESLPRPLLVGLGLVVGLGLIFLFNPPHTPCADQFEILKTSQNGFFFVEPKGNYDRKTGYEKAVNICKFGNSPGACLDLFNGLRRLHRDLESVPTDCSYEVINQEAVRKNLWDSMELVVQLAWGTKPPASSFERLGWFDTFHASIYCEQKKLLVTHFGNDEWSRFIDEKLKALPQASALSRNDAWQRTILSFPCETL